MKDRTAGLYKRVSFTVEIAFGLLLVFNGFILIANYFGLSALQEKFSNFFKSNDFWAKSANEWRSFIEFIHAMIATHIAAVVMIFTGLLILIVAIRRRKSP